VDHHVGRAPGPHDPDEEPSVREIGKRPVHQIIDVRQHGGVRRPLQERHEPSCSHSNGYADRQEDDEADEHRVDQARGLRKPAALQQDR
jgi:hypothetical protein